MASREMPRRGGWSDPDRGYRWSDRLGWYDRYYDRDDYEYMYGRSMMNMMREHERLLRAIDRTTRGINRTTLDTNRMVRELYGEEPEPEPRPEM